MEKVYESKYLQMYFDAEHKLVEQVWMPETEYMNEEEYKYESLVHANKLVGTETKKILADTRNFFFPIVPALQEWTNERAFPILLEIGVAQVAIIVSQEFVSQISIEQLLQEEVGAKFTTRYFGTREEAWEWLVSK